jgi:serine/threonine protein kinase
MKTISTVLRASRDGQDFAVKIIDKKEIKENPLISDCIKSEMDILRITKHPNIISINDSFEDQDRIYIVMEIGGCDLFHFMENFCRKGLAVDKTRRIFSQLVDAVYFLHHDAMLCHRDLKLENILVKKHSLEVKVCDFGLSCKIDKVKMLRTRCGSLEYVSPEIIKGEPYRGEQVDCWALGVILFALGTGVLPFILDPSRPKSVYHKICRGEYSYPRYQTNVTPLMKDLISRILVPSPTERLSICEIRNHPFLSSPKDNVYTTELI